MNVTKEADLMDNLVSWFEQKAPEITGKFPMEIAERKKIAYRAFQEKGFPTPKNEEYKYTNFKPVLNREYRFVSTHKLSIQDIEQFHIPGLKANQLTFLNGTYENSLSELIDINDFEIIKLSEADPEIVKKFLATAPYTEKDPFALLNTALFTEGVFLKIKANREIKHPIVFNMITDATNESIFVQPRILILTEKNARATLIENNRSLGTNYAFTNLVSELIQMEDATTTFYKVQDLSETTYQVNTTNIRLEQKSVFNAATISLGGAIVRNTLNIGLNSPYSEATFYGLYILRNKQLIDNHTLVDHAVPNCLSNELYKGILDNHSTGVFNGKILVRQDAQKTNAFQSNKNILLSRDAVMNTKPQLEIFADDVKCSHGATVGQLEEEPLFYLRSRGMSEVSARALLLQAFAQDVLDHLNNEPLKNHLHTSLENVLSI